MCSAAALGGASHESGTGSSANFGKWWVRSAQQKRAEPAAARDPDISRDLPASLNCDHSPSADDCSSRVSRYGYEFLQHTTEHFQVLYRGQDVPAKVLTETGDLLELAYEEFVKQFKRAGFELDAVDARLPWVVFDDHGQYQDYARLADGMTTTYLESYYAARSNQVVLMQLSGSPSWRTDRNYYQRVEPSGSRSLPIAGMDQPAQAADRRKGGGMLDVRRAVHEAAHQLAFNMGLQKRGVMYPLWVSEGLATNFECDSVSQIGASGENAPRQRQLLRARAGGRLMSLHAFIALVQIRPDGPSSANDLYAQSWAFFNFLFKTRQADLKEYLDLLAGLDPGTRDEHTMREEFISAFGSIDRLERAWERHLDTLGK